jgi:hypothetical protein
VHKRALLELYDPAGRASSCYVGLKSDGRRTRVWMSRRGSPHAAFGRALAWGGGQRHGGAPRTGQVLDRDEDEGGSHGPGAGSCVRAPPHPPVWIARWDSSYQSRATRSDFRNRFRFPAEPAGWSCPETAPFFFDRRVPGRKFVIAVADRARSAPGRLSRLLRPGYTMPASETRLFRRGFHNSRAKRPATKKIHAA